jgi:hypothetical protein
MVDSYPFEEVSSTHRTTNKNISIHKAKGNSHSSEIKCKQNRAALKKSVRLRSLKKLKKCRLRREHFETLLKTDLKKGLILNQIQIGKCFNFLIIY